MSRFKTQISAYNWRRKPILITSQLCADFHKITKWLAFLWQKSTAAKKRKQITRENKTNKQKQAQVEELGKKEESKG